VSAETGDEVRELCHNFRVIVEQIDFADSGENCILAKRDIVSTAWTGFLW
jgi:hypothetical protein